MLSVVVLMGGCSYGTTQPATDVTDIGATLHGYVAGDAEDGSTYWFEYGRASTSESKTPDRTTPDGASSPYSVEEQISGLDPNTVYHFQLCARDTTGQATAGCNSPQQLRTQPGPSPVSIETSPALFPAFDAHVTDYALRCTGAPVTFSVTAPAGTDVSIDQLAARSGTFTQDVQLAAGQRADFSVAGGSGTTTHHVRCLPDDFPHWTYSLTGQPSQQWTLTSVILGTTDSRYAMFFDEAGVPVWWYKPPDGTRPIDAKLLSDETLAFGEWTVGSFSADPARKYQVRRLDGSLVRTWQAVGTPTDFHEMQELPGGNHLLISYKPRDHVDLSAFGKPSDATVLDAEIQEVGPTGSVVWSWNSKDHIALAETGRWWDINGSTRLPDGRDAWDIVHINAVEPDGDGLLVSLRHTDAIYRINRGDGHVEWKLGGTTTPQSLSVSHDVHTSPLGGQHDVRRLPDGTVSVFDNRTRLSGSPRMARFSINPAAKTAMRAESLSDPDIATSVCCGSARKLSSGGWLIAWGGLATIGEYAADQSRVFKLRITDSNVTLYRAFPVPAGRISATQLRAGMDAMFPR